MQPETAAAWVAAMERCFQVEGVFDEYDRFTYAIRLIDLREQSKISHVTTKLFATWSELKQAILQFWRPPTRAERFHEALHNVQLTKDPLGMLQELANLLERPMDLLTPDELIMW